MKKVFLIAAITAILSACSSDQNPQQTTDTNSEVHSVVVKEVLQTNKYTYLRVSDSENEPWLAVPQMQATVGQTYFYSKGMTMNNFESKDLNRTFNAIVFLDNISTTKAIVEKGSLQEASLPESGMNPSQEQGQDQGQMPKVAHVIIAQEVLQTTQYTYIRAKEGENEIWLAAAKMDATVGRKYYFDGGLPMKDFPSKELKKTFKEILFLDNITDQPSSSEESISASSQTITNSSKGSAIEIEKKEVKVKHEKNDVTIAALFENKNTYADKKIKIKGQVSKFTPGIMKRNWIHLQDGTDFSGKFDLTITSDQEVKVGENIVIEGVIKLEKDFGYGYFYDVIMEDAKLVK